MADERPQMKMLPGDEVRQIMWRFADRFDLQMAVAGARNVARGLVAKLVADGQRKTHDWTPEKQGPVPYSPAAPYPRKRSRKYQK